MIGQEFNITAFVSAIIFATVVGIVGLLAGLKGIGLLIPKWNIKDSFKHGCVTNSGLIISVYIFALGMIVAAAIY